MLLVKQTARELLRAVHPRAITAIRVADDVVREETVRRVAAFFFSYIAILIVSALALTILGLPVFSALTSAAATMGGVGPAMGAIVGGPAFTFADVHPLSKLVLIFDMWVGRLEIFTALLLFFPATYRR